MADTLTTTKGKIFYHYTDRKGADGIAQSLMLAPNPQGQVFFTCEKIPAREVSNALFLGDHAEKGEYVVEVICQEGLLYRKGKSELEFFMQGTIRDPRHVTGEKKMTSKGFFIEDFYELLAMQRVFREAKFCFEPSDDEISSSPIVARLAQRLMEALVNADVERKGEKKKNDWDDWLSLDETREEWGVALTRTKKEQRWESWSEKQQREYLQSLLSPFILTEENLKKFMREVNAQNAQLKKEASKEQLQDEDVFSEQSLPHAAMKNTRNKLIP
ncbi:hypothetical protein GJ698_29235 [Pseudoduganella sp. FT26W]|uniref:Uncharacterized protein n=1 Tax=Duganella aquatilis TaxID=2666082 RepID=A0A844D7Q4_9BURK|nr:hypothetical protein [Duganella aquatilis]MRW88168.1 hypothetical protein [Duganella aquatilis]